MVNIKKIKNKFYEDIILHIYWKTNHEKYTKKHANFYRNLGVNIGQPSYIDKTTWIDSVNFSLIKIDDGVVISRNCSILVHDYSVNNALRVKKYEPFDLEQICKPVTIGKDTFIGLGSILLPGTTIGNNVIVGAGSVVRGIIEPFSIVIGNPAIKVGDVREWIDHKLGV